MKRLDEFTSGSTRAEALIPLMLSSAQRDLTTVCEVIEELAHDADTLSAWFDAADDIAAAAGRLKDDVLLHNRAVCREWNGPDADA